MIILDIDKPERCGKCPMHNDGNDYCKLVHDHASFVRAKGCPIQTIKTGHWIEKDGFDGDVYYDCSECGESWATIEGTPWDNEWDYCPSCGAKMVEPQETQENDHKCHTCKHYTSGERDGSCGSYICKGHSNWESEDKE